MNEDFSKNLRNLCADRGSIAQVCREIGINRQQFNRYLTGAGLPSAQTLRKIARYFEISEAEMFQPHVDFYAQNIQIAAPSKHSHREIFAEMFEDQTAGLRRYAGFYQTHFLTPSWPGMIMRGLIWMREIDGMMTTRSLEKVNSSDGSIRQRMRYDGLVAINNGRIYVVEKERADGGAITETILFSAYRHQVKYLRGMSLGLAWRPRLTPCAAPNIWKKLGDAIPLRDAVEACGVFGLHSTRIDPTVRKFLSDGSKNGSGQVEVQEFY